MIYIKKYHDIQYLQYKHGNSSRCIPQVKVTYINKVSVNLVYTVKTSGIISDHTNYAKTKVHYNLQHIL